MAIEFPNSPVEGDQFTASNGVIYTYENGGWNGNSASGLEDVFVNISGDEMTGNLTVPSLNGGQLGGFRNQIINGDFRVWQRQPVGTGDSGKIIVTGKDMYTADRWSTRGPDWTGGITKMSKNTIPTLGGSPLIEVTGHTSFFTLTQFIEPENARGLLGGEATISFVTNFPDSIVTVETYNADGSTNAMTVPSPVLSNGKYSTTFTMPSGITAADDERGMNVRIYANGLSGALPDGSYYLTNVQLEPGPVATPFEHRPIGTELALCQRYCFISSLSRPYQIATGNNSEDRWYAQNAPFPVTMRTTPSIEVFSEYGEGIAGLLGLNGVNRIGASETIAANISADSVAVRARDTTGDSTTAGFYFSIRAYAEL